jgi:hypothetical protein
VQPIIFAGVYDALRDDRCSVNGEVVDWIEYGNWSDVSFGFASIEIADVEGCCGKEYVGANAGC